MKPAWCVLPLLLAALPTLAAAQLNGNERIVATVPFDFVVADKLVPAGLYSVQSASLNGTALSLQNVAGRIAVYTPDALDEAASRADNYVLVFKTYGHQHFLWKVRIKGSRVTCRLPVSKAESEMRVRRVRPLEETLLAELRH
jgi:hypothetical protein